jgi:hypothetical protein
MSMIIQRTAHAELAIKMLENSYAYDKVVKLTVNQAADLLVWIRSVEKYLKDLSG